MISPSFKFIVVLLILSFLVFFPVLTAKAASGWLIILKEYTLDLVARIIGRVMMSTLSNTVVGKILTSGPDGGPVFIQNWRDFLQTSQYTGEDTARAIIGDAIDPNSGTVCPYLRSTVGSVFGAGKVPGFNPSSFRVSSLQYFSLRNKCTLPSNFNLGQFQNDFIGGGGWSTWDKLIQPQNNFGGVYNDTLDELNNQRGFQESINSQEANSGGGYMSKKTGCSGAGSNLQCLIAGKIITPGDLLGKSAASTIDSEFKWLASVDEIQEALVSLAGVIGERLSNLAAGTVLGTNQSNLGPSTGESPAPSDAVQQAKDDCLKQREAGCTIKAKKLDCSVSASGGNGGSGGSGNTNGGSGGNGGSASSDCTETIDQSIFDACMADAKTACGL